MADSSDPYALLLADDNPATARAKQYAAMLANYQPPAPNSGYDPSQKLFAQPTPLTPQQNAHFDDFLRARSDGPVTRALTIGPDAVGSGIDAAADRWAQGTAQGLQNLVETPGRVMTGDLDISSPQARQWGPQMALTMATGGLGAAEPSSVGVFGGRLAQSFEHPSPSYVAHLGEGAPVPPQAANLSSAGIPAPVTPLTRFLDETKGMSTNELLSSESLWGRAQQAADDNGIPFNHAFSQLANEAFYQHGHNAYMTPSTAGRFIASERAKYGMGPSLVPTDSR